MAYKTSVYLRAKQALDDRRKKAEALYEQRHSEVLAACPALGELERKLAFTGAEAVKCAACGENAAAKISELSVENLKLQQERAALLRKAGFPEDYLENVYTCPLCRDTGHRGSYYCKCYLDLIRQTAKEAIPAAAMLRKCTFDSFDLSYYSDAVDPALGKSHRRIMTTVVEYLKDYCSDFTPASKGLLMLGKTGLGKTHLSLAVVNCLIDRGFNVYYGTAQNILDRLQKVHFSRDAVDEELDDDLYRSDLLVIDDLGTEMVTSFTVSALYNLLNTRLGNGLPTVINTNLPLDELEQTYSQRFTSRLVGNCEIIVFYGRDIRQQQIRG